MVLLGLEQHLFNLEISQAALKSDCKPPSKDRHCKQERLEGLASYPFFCSGPVGELAC